jgi:hypothetical protein
VQRLPLHDVVTLAAALVAKAGVPDKPKKPEAVRPTQKKTFF